MFPGLVTELGVSMGSGLDSWLPLPSVVGRISVTSFSLVELWESFRRRLWHCPGPSGASDLEGFVFLLLLGPPVPCCIILWEEL